MFSRVLARAAPQVTRSVVRAVPQASRAYGARFAGAGLGVASALTLTVVSAGEEPKKVNYTEVADAIRKILDKEGYDDGSLGPVFIRLAWHAAGAYSKVDGTGGSNGATMRFAPEADYGANAGLNKARAELEVIKAKFPGISYADLWQLAGAVAIEEMGGPKIPFRGGRTDAADGKTCTPNGRLPDAAQGAQHIRDIFYRMGFEDREIVALLGAHSVGRCHTDRSGFEGPWTRAPTTFSNLYFKELLENKWAERKWSGPKQFADPTGELMMLPADLAIRDDPKFREWAEKYAKDEKLFFEDFTKAWVKLQENGVNFSGSSSSSGAKTDKWRPLILVGVLALFANSGK